MAVQKAAPRRIGGGRGNQKLYRRSPAQAHNCVRGATVLLQVEQDEAQQVEGSEDIDEDIDKDEVKVWPQDEVDGEIIVAEV